FGANSATQGYPAREVEGPGAVTCATVAMSASAIEPSSKDIRQYARVSLDLHHFRWKIHEAVATWNYPAGLNVGRCDKAALVHMFGNLKLKPDRCQASASDFQAVEPGQCSRYLSSTSASPYVWKFEVGAWVVARLQLQISMRNGPIMMFQFFFRGYRKPIPTKASFKLYDNLDLCGAIFLFRAPVHSRQDFASDFQAKQMFLVIFQADVNLMTTRACAGTVYGTTLRLQIVNYTQFQRQSTGIYSEI
ncbi:hypothetical protein EDD22DRAFT_856293, partial [Suillus occidentalis]